MIIVSQVAIIVNIFFFCDVLALIVLDVTVIVEISLVVVFEVAIIIEALRASELASPEEKV